MPLIDPRRLAGLLLAAGGCVNHAATATVDPADAPVPLSVDVSRGVGSPLKTAAAPPASVDAGDLIGLDLTWIALTRVPDGDLLPLDAQSSLTSAPLAAGAVLARGRDTRAARFGVGDAAMHFVERLARRDDGPAVETGHTTAWVAPGTSVRFLATAGDPARIAAVEIYRADAPTPAATRPANTTVPAAAVAAASFAVTLGGTDTLPKPPAKTPSIRKTVSRTAARASREVTTRPTVVPTVETETAFVTGLTLSPGTSYALVLPWPSASGPWQALAVYVEVRPSAEATDDAATAPSSGGADAPPATADAAADWNRFLAARRGATGGPRPAAATRPGEQTTLARALDALRRGGDPRPALTYLAAVTRARVAGDVALVADDTLLGKLRDSVAAADASAAAPEAVGWLLDRTALLTLADAAAKAPLPPETVAALAVHTGEVGRHPDTLAAVVSAVGSAAGLSARLVAENYIALEDSSASSRVRAFDWLRAQGRAPAGYDPLGPARARRAAINKALTAPGGTP